MPESSNTSPVVSLAKAIEILLHDEDLMHAIEKALELIGESARQDRAYLFELHTDPKSGRMLMSQRCEWVSEGTEPEIGNTDLVNADIGKLLPRWPVTFLKNEIIEGPVRTFPEMEQTLLHPQGILSLVCVPIFCDDHLCGFIGFDNCHLEYVWTEQDKALLRTIATAIGAAKVRQENLQQLKDGEERFRKLIQGNPTVAVQGFYEDGRITFWNRASEILYGYSANEVLGTNMFEVATMGENPSELEDLFRSLKSYDDESRPSVQATYRHKDGHEVPVLTCIISLERSQQETEYFAFDLDLTEQKELEAKLLQSQRLEAIGSLASGIAHDLNNVLAPMLMSLDSLKFQEELSSDVRTFLEVMDKSTQRAVDMSRQLLSFAKGMDVQNAEVDMKGVLEELLTFLQGTFPKDITIGSSFLDELPVLQGDPTQIHQILLNLAVNARDAMPDGGKLQFKAFVENLASVPTGAMGERFIRGDHVVVEVSDTGAGMEQETLLKIFEPFFSTKDEHKGSGLGLSTSLGILKSHSAWIYVQSFPGVGTTFRLFFPATEVPSEQQKECKDESMLPRGAGECILVADDEASIRDITCEVLERNGYQTLSAENGQKAVELFREHPEINLVITDLMMPVVDGTEAMKQYRGLRSEVPLVATSGLSSTNVDTESARGLADRFMSKPYRTTVLLQVVAELLGSDREG